VAKRSGTRFLSAVRIRQVAKSFSRLTDDVKSLLQSADMLKVSQLPAGDHQAIR
jgi:hypothetical protein